MEPKRITEYHSQDWETLVETGWLTERVIEPTENDPLALVAAGKRIAVMRRA